MSDFLARIGHFSAKRLSLLADELNDRVLQLEVARRAPVAIVGIGCRLPGGVDSPQAYWQLLRDGIDAISEVPPERWPVDAYYDPDPDAAGKICTRWGGFVGPVDGFDAGFFGISPREAHSMDPQQRLLLEVTWRALEDAGIAPPGLAGVRAGVYVGMSASDYYHLLRAAGGTAAFDAYTASGTAHSIASGRLSYTLGLRGPSLSIDTACSSSLVAIHEAVHSLRRGESDLALAGGVNLILSPDITVALSRARMMAPDGRCKAFDARADGFVRGEGCAMLVLKRLADARAAGDRVLAVIAGSAANQDGRSNGLTAPNGPAQEAVLRDALADAGCHPYDIGYVEAHGTGTSLGDPIELQALHAVLGVGRTPGAPLRVGSVKANVGHLEAASGVAGLIKVVLALRHGQVPGQLHLQQPNPLIPWERLAIEVPRTLTEWPAGDAPRRAGVSSFGFSGTNVHIVLEEAPRVHVADVAGPERPLHIFTVSARSEAALDELSQIYGATLLDPGSSLPDLAYAANAGRAHFAQRGAVLASTTAEAAERMTQLRRGVTEGVQVGHAPARPPRVAFLFTGQGSQYVGMAKSLYDCHPVFRETIDRCEQILRGHLARPLCAVLFPAAGEISPIEDTAYTQPALFALEYALAQLWLSWGVRPHALLGHSVGEIVAACVAGVFSLEDALAIVAVRGRLMAALPRDGGMVAVTADERQVRKLLARHAGALDVAAVNGPVNTVVSGCEAALQSFLIELQAEGLSATRLQVSHAFHSPLMEPMLGPFEDVLADVKMQAPSIDLISNVTGRRAGAEIGTAAYWREHVRATVRFAPSMQTLSEAGMDIFLEVGPHPVLSGMGAQCTDMNSHLWLPSLRRGRDDWATLLDSLAQLYVAGVPVNWSAFDAPYPRRHATLPGYPFQRERYWVNDPVVVASEPVLRPDLDVHPLLGREVLHPFSDERLFETRLHVSLQPYLADHRIQGSVVLPSPVCMEIAMAAARQLVPGEAGDLMIEDLSLHRALQLDGERPVILQTILSPQVDGVAALRLLTRDEHERDWVPLATAKVRRVAAAPAPPLPMDAVRARIVTPVDVDIYYGWLASLGLEFGSFFRGIEALWRADGEVLASVRLPASLRGTEQGMDFHPALLDACFHVVGAALPGGGSTLSDAFLLMNVERLRVRAPPGPTAWVHVKVHEVDNCLDLARSETFRADLHLHDPTGALLAAFDGVHFKRARPGALRPVRLPARVQSMLYEVAWRELPTTARQSLPQLAQSVETDLPAVAQQHGFEHFAEFLPGLDALVAAYVLRALQALGKRWVVGEAISSTDRVVLGVHERHQRLFERMLEILTEDDWLRRTGDQWQVQRADALPDPELLAAALEREHPDALAELQLTRRCGRELAEVLRGQSDPLALLFPGGSLADTERLYRDSPTAQAYNGLIATIVESLAAASPASKPLRVLEIGAGTGSTTAYVLPRLAGRAIEYTFTDVSPLFLKRAQQHFAGHDGLRYALLDIGQIPSKQGFESAAYDLIVGANVLHATPDLRLTLEHVRSRLAPGGTLVLLEAVLPQRFGDLTVGLLDGWWAFTDTALRKYALLPRRQWLELLTESGFTAAVAVPGETEHPVWKQQAIFLASAAADDVQRRSVSRWLLMPDGSGVGQALAVALRARGDQVELLSAAMPPADALSAVLKTGNKPEGVVSLVALDCMADDAQTADELMAGQERVLGRTVALVQAMVASPVPLPLWLVSRGAAAVRGDDDANPAQATLWGLSHVVAIEHPDLACRRIDLDPATDVDRAATELLAELDAPGAEDQSAIRGGCRCVRRLRPALRPPGGLTGMPIDAGRSYLVTGGLHGLGLRVARWLVERGARHLALMGRRAPDGAAAVEIDALRKLGTDILVSQGDVGDDAQVARLIAMLREGPAPLAGIVHAAGALDDGVLTALTWPRFETVMAAKVRGSWNLHRMAGDLDFFVIFSSGASVGGSAGQANHAAANAFEDALAWHRSAQGHPTLSINWGPWAEIGAAADRRFTQMGPLHPIAPADGLAALEHLLRRDARGRFRRAQMAVLATDWSHLGPAREAGNEASLYRDLVPTMVRSAPTARATPARPPEPTLRERMANTIPNRRLALLREEVRQLTARVLGLPGADELPLDEPLRQLGLDSLMAVELRNLLGKAVGQSLPATVTFEYPSVRALVDHLAATAMATELVHAAPTAPLPVQEEAAPPPATASLEGLDADELARRLMNRLDQLDHPETL
jgi:acyl transferase domain-containing protein/acyl carrier protein/protein-L-isoaspartate O-methyltransferase